MPKQGLVARKQGAEGQVGLPEEEKTVKHELFFEGTLQIGVK